jgi:hypothetical protein
MNCPFCDKHIPAPNIQVAFERLQYHMHDKHTLDLSLEDIMFAVDQKEKQTQPLTPK